MSSKPEHFDVTFTIQDIIFYFPIFPFEEMEMDLEDNL